MAMQAARASYDESDESSDAVASFLKMDEDLDDAVGGSAPGPDFIGAVSGMGDAFDANGGAASGSDAEGDASALDLDELVRVAAAAARQKVAESAPTRKRKLPAAATRELDSQLPSSRYIDYRSHGSGAGATLRTASAATPDADLLARGASDAVANPTGKAAPLRRPRPRKDTSAGKAWFGMPLAEMTPELKRDVQAIRMRNFIDPKRFYKANDAPSKFLQLGTVKEGAADWKAGRLHRKQRGRTVVEELLADPEVRRYTKGTFLSIQEEKQRGRKKSFAKGKLKKRK